MLAYAASRLMVGAAMWLADLILPESSFLDLAKEWDGSWYYEIIVSGYPRSLPEIDGVVQVNTTGFFPLFPMAARGIACAPRDRGRWMRPLFVSIGSGLLATCLVWVLADNVWNRPIADRSAVLFAFFPGSFIFSIAYSEGLMLALTAGCLVALHRAAVGPRRRAGGRCDGQPTERGCSCSGHCRRVVRCNSAQR